MDACSVLWFTGNLTALDSLNTPDILSGTRKLEEALKSSPPGVSKDGDDADDDDRLVFDFKNFKTDDAFDVADDGDFDEPGVTFADEDDDDWVGNLHRLHHPTILLFSHSVHRRR